MWTFELRGSWWCTSRRGYFLRVKIIRYTNHCRHLWSVVHGGAHYIGVKSTNLCGHLWSVGHGGALLFKG